MFTHVAEHAPETATAAKLDALNVAQLGLTPRPRRAPGWGAVASIALHGAFVLAALLWSQSQTERAPEPIAVEIVVERAPDPAPVQTPTPTVDTTPPVAETPPPAAVETPVPTPESTPSPVAEAPSPEPTPTPLAVETPVPTPEPTPPPKAVETPVPTPTPSEVAAPPIVETPPPPIAKVEPAKPAPSPTLKKPDRTPQTSQKPKPKPAAKPVASHETPSAEPSPSRAAPAASSASVGEYSDAVYARLRARQHFPEAAREADAHGTAELTFTLDASGQLQSVSLLKSSGNADLDADALATVRRSAPFGPPPPGAPRQFPVKLHYRLQ